MPTSSSCRVGDFVPAVPSVLSAGPDARPPHVAPHNPDALLGTFLFFLEGSHARHTLPTTSSRPAAARQSTWRVLRPVCRIPRSARAHRQLHPRGRSCRRTLRLLAGDPARRRHLCRGDQDVCPSLSRRASPRLLLPSALPQDVPPRSCRHQPPPADAGTERACPAATTSDGARRLAGGIRPLPP